MNTKPLLILLPALTLLPSPARAKLLDNFDDNVKTNWADFTFLPGGAGTPVEQGGRFTFTLPAIGQSFFSASTLTSETFSLQEGRKIVFSVDVVSTNGADAFALLSFIPKSRQVSELAGYSMAKSEQNFLLVKGIDKYFYNDAPKPPVKNENITMVLTLTVKNGSVYINSRILDKDNGNAVIFEQNAVDTPAADTLVNGTDDPAAPWLGEGNFVLLCYVDDGNTQPSYEAVFDNAEAYVMDEVVVDNFDDNTKTDWADFTFQNGFGLPVEQDGQFKFVQSAAGTSIFSASTKTSPTFSIKDGERLRFETDLVSTNGLDSFAILSFIPKAAQVGALAGYSLAKSETDVLLPKGINKYFFNDNVQPPVKNENVTLALELTANGGNVTVTGQVLDKDNDGAVLWEYTAVDTPAADTLVDGTDDPAAPWLGEGNFVLYCYQDDGNTQATYEVTFDNAVVWRAPVAGNTPPVITDVEPLPNRNFLPAATTRVSFKVADDAALPDAGISITLNGTVHTAASGLEISGPTNARVVSLGGLTPNTSYTAVLTVKDASGAERSETVTFDTFLPDTYVIEVEDFNFNGGAFFDNPAPIAEGSGPSDGSYANQTGTAGVDYFDTRDAFADVPYRPGDLPRMQRTLDYSRAKFTAAGGAEQSVFDYAVGDFQPDEWMNYTRTFPAGSYTVYLRQSMVNTADYEAVLEEVTGNTAEPDQATVPLGTFRGIPTGYQYGNVPLTSGNGTTPVVLTLGGKKTLRLRQNATVAADGSVTQNYLAFIRQPENSGFVITSITRDSGSGLVTLSWPSQAGETFKVESSPDMTVATWVTLVPALPGQAGSTSHTDTPPQGSQRRFYRVTRN